MENNTSTTLFLKSNYSGILFTLVVAFLCLYPFESQKESLVVHLTLFLVLSYFWMRGLSIQTQFKKVQEKAVLIAVVSVIAYGLLIEILQEVMQLGRAFDVLDIVADTAGVLFAFGIFRVVRD